MFLQLADVLDAERLARLRQICAGAAFTDGRASAGWHARTVKTNEQLADPALLAQVARLTAQALDAHALFQAAALPRYYGPMLLSRYREGMQYGSHIDDPLMGREPRIRADLAFTVFLDAEDACDGGALVIENTDGERRVKLPAGDAFVYPATTLHRVEPVTRGERRVLVGWAQSYIRDAACREMLFDLEHTARAIFQREGKSESFDRVTKTRANLIRRWADA
jgi:PKHD-type hydroxylase